MKLVILACCVIFASARYLQTQDTQSDETAGSLDKRGIFGGHINQDPFGGLNYGVHASHTFDNGLSLKGSVDHHQGRGTSYGVQGQWKFKRELAEREAAMRRQETAQESLDKRGIFGGHINQDPFGGLNYGVHASHTFDNGLSLKGSVDHHQGRGTSYGVQGQWKFKRELAEREAAMRRQETAPNSIVKRQWSLGGHLNDGFGGLSYGGHLSHTSGSTSIGGGFEHNKHSGTTLGGSFSHGFDNGGSLSGSVSHNVGGASTFGLKGGKTWNHSNGSSTSLTGQVSHSTHGGGSNVGVGLVHKFRRRNTRMAY